MKSRRIKHTKAERGLDFYQTCPEAVLSLMKVEQLPHAIWEPHCGLGGICEPLLDAGHAVYATDIVDRGYDHQRGVVLDFEKTKTAPTGIGGIIMNPPFSRAALHVVHAQFLVPYVAALLRLSFLEAGNDVTDAGRARLACLDRGHLARVHVFQERLPMMHRDGWDGKKSSSTVPYAWFVWDRAHTGPATISRISWRALTT